MIFANPSQINQRLPESGRVLGIDVGTKRIGLAISDSDQFIATPKLIINRQRTDNDLLKSANFINENNIAAIALGRPINMDGSVTPMTVFSEKFAISLDNFLQKKLPIFLFEERLTSFEARLINNSDPWRKKAKFFDDIAASLILQHFLDEAKSQKTKRD